jgi:hypothetical protein
MRRIAAVFAMVVGLGAIVAPSALADEYVCRGSVGARTVDNLKVPDGASCVLDGTIVQGTIKVETNATLRATGVQVDGNVQAEDAMLVVVRGRSKVGGSVQIVQGDAARVLRTRVIGDILYDENSRALKANYNRIGGNLQAFQNTGSVEIIGNRIDGNLQCKANKPAPTGGSNVVEGSKEDQCANL